MLLSHPDPPASQGLEHSVGLLEAHGKRALPPSPLHKVTRLSSQMAGLEAGEPPDSQDGIHGPGRPLGVAGAAAGCVGQAWSCCAATPRPPATLQSRISPAEPGQLRLLDQKALQVRLSCERAVNSSLLKSLSAAGSESRELEPPWGGGDWKEA